MSDDFQVQKIEVEFAIPVTVSRAFLDALHDLIDTLVGRPYNQPEGGVHWVSGHGQKPLWSQADARFLGHPVDPNAPETGEPGWDEDVYHIQTVVRPLRPGEQR
jgi:hypothetical protein